MKHDCVSYAIEEHSDPCPAPKHRECYCKICGYIVHNPDGECSGKVKENERMSAREIAKFQKGVLDLRWIPKMILLFALLFCGCQSTRYIHTIEWLDKTETIEVRHVKCMVLTDTENLTFQTPDGAKLGVGWMIMDPQVAVDFAEAVVPLWRLLEIYLAPLPVPAALGGKP